MSRQRPKYAHVTMENVLQEMFSMWSVTCPLLGNKSLNTFPRSNAQRNRTPIARQRRGKHAFATIEETAFSMGPPREYISSPVLNQKSVVERDRDWSEFATVKVEEFG
jgi:hypothetical protein